MASSSGSDGQGRSGGAGEDPAAKRARLAAGFRAARNRLGRKWSNRGMRVPPSCLFRESRHYRELESSFDSSAGGSSSRGGHTASPPSVRSGAPESRLALVPVKTEPQPRFAAEEGDYAADDDMERIAAELAKVDAGLQPGDFVDDAYLPTVVSLVEDWSRREKDKRVEWHLVSEEQRRMFVDLESSDEE